MTTKPNNLLMWILRIIPALILLQTLFYKFSAAPESVYIFSTLGIEPWGRILVGIFELIAAVLLIVPATSFLGAFLGTGLMAGAIFSHLTKLGIEVQHDGGYLFILALVVFTCCVGILIILRRQIPIKRFVS